MLSRTGIAGFLLLAVFSHAQLALASESVIGKSVGALQGETVGGSSDFLRKEAPSHFAKFGSSAFIDILGTQSVANRLSLIRPDSKSTTRGAHEAQLYRDVSPSVVLVLAGDSLGSGSLLTLDGNVITNYHVVGDSPEVGVIFKPLQEGQKLSRSSVVRAQVVKVDQVADLALLKVAEVPTQARPMVLGNMAAISVGSDVHAIGHPTGEAWTYTRGIVSQIRADYGWSTESGVEHIAKVIQTQTPINPGNSGGPLLDDSGKLVGINSFKTEGEALNFAVSVDDVQRFLGAQTSRKARVSAPAKTVAVDTCEATQVSQSRAKDPVGVSIAMDLDCNGTVDGYVLMPDDQSEPMLMAIDSDSNGSIDIVLIDEDRDGDPESSLHDTNGDGKPELVGYYKKGADEPYRYEPYVG